MLDLLDRYADDDMTAQEERDDILPWPFVNEVEAILKPYGGRVAQTGLPSMGKPSDRMLVWIADVPAERRKDALLALEDAGLWDRHSGFQA
ncbi:MAG: hypothetical protein F4Z50_03070 [Gemmatimonadetes bacterium]|nr:hypothetical protein [Gemmatimonadota bacterium]